MSYLLDSAETIKMIAKHQKDRKVPLLSILGIQLWIPSQNGGQSVIDSVKESSICFIPTQVITSIIQLGSPEN